jgi:hypothetical protein
VVTCTRFKMRKKGIHQMKSLVIKV